MYQCQNNDVGKVTTTTTTTTTTITITIVCLIAALMYCRLLIKFWSILESVTLI